MEKNIEPIKTRLKFEKSNRTKLWVGFVSINTSTGYIKGVRSTFKGPKMICVATANVAHQIQPEILYDVEMVPMKKGKSGYVVIKAVPHAFEAVLDSCVIHNAVYWVHCKFGNKTIIFNPLDGVQDNMRTIPGCIAELESRKDIANLPGVIAEFTKMANIVLTTFENDGYYVTKQESKSKASQKTQKSLH